MTTFPSLVTIIASLPGNCCNNFKPFSGPTINIAVPKISPSVELLLTVVTLVTVRGCQPVRGSMIC